MESPSQNLDADVVDMHIAEAGCGCDSCSLHHDLVLGSHSEAGDVHLRHGIVLVVGIGSARCVEQREVVHDLSARRCEMGAGIVAFCWQAFKQCRLKDKMEDCMTVSMIE